MASLFFLSLFFVSQKLIKELPSLVPLDDQGVPPSPKHNVDSAVESSGRDSTTERARRRSRDGSDCESSHLKQDHGDRTTEEDEATPEHASSSGPPKPDPPVSSVHSQGPSSMTRSPGEVAFFKLLHAEFKKAAHFFDRATEEFIIREERVREGMAIMKQPNSIMVNEKWSLMAKSIFRLYRDLLLLETFAIMAYCSFSKILKKHDKVTGYCTRCAFMSNIVNKANFTYYPKVLKMINRCESLYEEVSRNLLQEGKGGLYEDERLFINMIHRLNEQVLSSDKDSVSSDRIDAVKRPAKTMPPSQAESKATSTIRSIVEENDQAKALPEVSDAAHCCNDDDSDDCENDPSNAVKTKNGRKRVCFTGPPISSPQMKKRRMSPAQLAEG